MANQGEVYVCEICGQEIEVKKPGGGELKCCEQPMTQKSK